MEKLNKWKKVTSAAYDPAFEYNRVLFAVVCTIIRFGLYFLCIFGPAHGSPQRGRGGLNFSEQAPNRPMTDTTSYDSFLSSSSQNPTTHYNKILSFEFRNKAIIMPCFLHRTFHKHLCPYSSKPNITFITSNKFFPILHCPMLLPLSTLQSW